jgi:hypothetical protein
MPRTKDTTVAIAPVVALSDGSVQTGQRTAKIAAEILRESGFIVPTASEREALLIAFVRAGYVIYGKAFDVVKCETPMDLTSSDDVLKHIKNVKLFEIKSTNKRTVKPDFRGYFFSLSTAELLVAQNLGAHYGFAFVNTRTREHEEFTLLDLFKRARGIYPTWSIQF